jgi:hypothetical protein
MAKAHKTGLKKTCRRCPGGLPLTKCAHSKEHRLNAKRRVDFPDADSAPVAQLPQGPSDAPTEQLDPFLVTPTAILQPPLGTNASTLSTVNVCSLFKLRMIFDSSSSQT